MYLHMLEKDEKTAFLSFAKYLAKVDDKVISNKEHFMIRYMAAEMGLDPDEAIEDAFSQEHLVKVFHRDRAKRVLILEGLGIAHANGKFEAEQYRFLVQLAKDLMLPDDYVGRAEGVVRMQLHVMQEFEALLGG